MADGDAVGLSEATGGGKKPNAETDETLSPEEHITKLNHENAERRRENKELKDTIARLESSLSEQREQLAAFKAKSTEGESTKERLARLERGIKKSAVAKEVQRQVARKRETLEASGKSLNEDALQKLITSNSINIRVDFDEDVVMDPDGESAFVRTVAQDRIGETIGGLLDTIAVETTVVPPNKPKGEGVADRGQTPLSEVFDGATNSWDEASPLAPAAKGKKTVEKTMKDPVVETLLGALMSR